MKIKHLLATAVALLCTASSWAQTDVTSTYLTNPSFEYSASGTPSTAQALTSGATYYGWELPSLGASYVNLSIGNNTTCNGQAFGIPNAKDGSFYYFNRRGWNSSSSADGTLSTTMTSVPIGHYEVTVWYKGYEKYNSTSGTAAHKTNGSYLKITIVESESTLATAQTGNFDKIDNKDNTSYFTGDSNWKSQSLTFDVTTEGDVTLNIIEHLVGGVRADVIIDHITLTYTNLELSGYIKKATALNAVLENSTLASAISTAESALASATPSTDVSDAVSAISGAISTALSSLTPVALTNGNFNSSVDMNTSGTHSAEAINTTNASAYQVSGWTGNFGSEWVYGATSVYNTSKAVINGVASPAFDMFCNSDGGVLHFSSGWGNQARYKQTIEDLPSGRYIFYYEANNQNSAATSINSNYFGISGTAGDFYGTSNAFVYDSNKSFPYNEWNASAFEFDVAKTANIDFHVGIVGASNGSANGAKLWIDNVLVYRYADIMVTEEEATAIIESAEALDDVKYNATDKSSLASALSAFEAAQNIDNYNALNAAIIQANASKDVYTTLNAAIAKVEGWTATSAASGIRTKYNNGTYSNETTANDIYAEYQAAEIAALTADGSAVDWTSVILNASFETGDMTGWSAESRTDTGVKDQSNGTYSIISGDPVDGLKLFNSWGGTEENNVYQTIKNLPADTYTLTALLAGFKDETLVLAANETTNNVVVAGDKTVGYTVSVKFTLADAADVVIKASNTKSQDGSDASFIKADNFRLYKGDVMTDDYTALNAAITAARAKTLGFDEGEYAPYNNVDAITALAAAEAVNQERKIAQPVLDAIVSDLTSATWSANIAEVNGFYDGDFAIQDEHTTGPTALTGWNNPAGIRQLIKNTVTYPGLTSATEEAAVFAWGNTTMIYGETEGYTLPLNAHTIYELSFKTCGWSDGDLGYVNVDIKNASNEGLQTVSTVTATKRITESNPWDEFRILFATGEAGNYKFGMWTSKHTVFTDLALVKAASQTLTFAEDGTTPKYAAGTYPTVALDRTFSTTNRSTMVLPFAMTSDETSAAFSEVYELTDVDGESIKFTSASSITAGTPYLVKAKSSSLSVSNKTVNPATKVTNTEVSDASSTVTFVGLFEPTTLTSSNSNAYVVSSNTLYNVTSNVSMAAYRGYFTVDAVGGVKNFVLDFGDETAIKTVEATQNEKAVIYNLAGQRMSKLQRGVNIVNGKKVLVK